MLVDISGSETASPSEPLLHLLVLNLMASNMSDSLGNLQVPSHDPDVPYGISHVVVPYHPLARPHKYAMLTYKQSTMITTVNMTRYTRNQQHCQRPFA